MSDFKTPDNPISREEVYLAYMAGTYTGSLPEPVTRIDHYLYVICVNGGAGGGGSGGTVDSSEIAALQEAVGTLSEKVETNESAISALKETVSTLESETDDSLGLSVVDGAINFTYNTEGK